MKVHKINLITNEGTVAECYIVAAGATTDKKLVEMLEANNPEGREEDYLNVAFGYDKK